jgi:hypothetical protein
MSTSLEKAQAELKKLFGEWLGELLGEKSPQKISFKFNDGGETFVNFLLEKKEELGIKDMSWKEKDEFGYTLIEGVTFTFKGSELSIVLEYSDGTAYSSNED